MSEIFANLDTKPIFRKYRKIMTILVMYLKVEVPEILEYSLLHQQK